MKLKMLEKEYRAYPAVSRSELWDLKESPEKMLYRRETPMKQTPALLLGSVFHMLMLQPQYFADQYVLEPEGINKRTKAGKEAYEQFLFEAESKGLEVISQDVYDHAYEMKTAAMSNRIIARLLDGAETEQTFVWHDDLSGLDCKIRTDALTFVDGTPVIVDLKTCASAEARTFTRHSLDYGYDLQAGYYSAGIENEYHKKPKFIFVAVEKEPPYSVNVFDANEDFVNRGRVMARELLGEYAWCKEHNNYYGYMGRDEFITDLILPTWAKEEK